MRIKYLLSFLCLFIFLFQQRGFTQTDSVNVVEFQNKEYSAIIDMLKIGKRVRIKIQEEDTTYWAAGQVTSITDSCIVLDNMYNYSFDSDSIIDYRFNKHIFGKVILGIAGTGVFLYGTIWAAAGTVLGPGLVGFIIFNAAIAVAGGIMIGNAFAKMKHPVSRWNVRVKRVKN